MQKIIKYSLRIPSDLYDQVVAIANKTDRSIHGAIINSLRKTVSEFYPEVPITDKEVQ